MLVEQARKEGIDKTPEYLNRQRQAEEQLLISMLANRRLNTAQLPSDREVQDYIASHPGDVRQSRDLGAGPGSVYPTPKDPGIDAEIMKTQSMDQLVAVLQSHKIDFERQKNRLDTAIMPAELYAKLSALPAGRALRRSSWRIARWRARSRAGNPARSLAIRPSRSPSTTMRKAQTGKALEGLLKSLSSSAKIEYQPGYGPPKKS